MPAQSPLPPATPPSTAPLPYRADRTQQCSWTFSAQLSPLSACTHTQEHSLSGYTEVVLQCFAAPQQYAGPHSCPFSSNPGAAQCAHLAVRCLRPHCCCAEAAPPNLPHLGRAELPGQPDFLCLAKIFINDLICTHTGEAFSVFVLGP